MKITPDLVDAWRVVPRLLVAGYGVMCWIVADWFMGLADPTGPQTTFATGIWGGAAVWFGFYVNSGRKHVDVDRS